MIRYGVMFTGHTYINIFATVTGQMDDGTKVWTECDAKGNLINTDVQYSLQTRGGWSEFCRL